MKRLTSVASKATTTLSQQQRYLSSGGTRGARGHGWLHQYRKGEGGRHLQGRYHDRDREKLVSINNEVFSLNETYKETTDIPSKVYIDLSVEGEEESRQRVAIELASAALPKTCKNFIALCQDEDLGYKSTKLFRVEKNVGLCLGDNTPANNGKGGRCHPSAADQPQNPNIFSHEALVLSHSQKGIVTMLSSGLDKNDSRFMITTVDDAPHLDGKFVAFGRVTEGLENLVQIAENTFTKKGRPTINIEVANCGLL